MKKSIYRCLGNKGAFMSERGKRGFTLVELLVVIAIIGILVGLLLPAVQAAREAARRCQCSNNLAQLGLAAHHYEFNYGALPPGTINSEGPIRYEPIGNHTNWLMQILPYMEQSAVHAKYKQNAGVYAPENHIVRVQHISIMRCPSSSDMVANVQGEDLPLSSYAGCHHSVESPIDQDNLGVFFLNSRVKFAEISDGTSNTILIGEKYARNDQLGWASGTRDTLRNTGSFEVRPKLAANGPSAAASGSLGVGGFGSYHAGGVQTVLADGSVHFISQNIEPELFQKLGHRADGELLNDITGSIW